MKMLLWLNMAMLMCIFTVIQPVNRSVAEMQNISGYKWKKRPILIFTSPGSYLAYKKQIKILMNAKTALDERDIIVLFDDDIGKDTDLRRSFAPDGFLFVLVGKDGGVKFKSTQPVSILEIIGIVDAMPMRQREMREQN